MSRHCSGRLFSIIQLSEKQSRILSLSTAANSLLPALRSPPLLSPGPRPARWLPTPLTAAHRPRDVSLDSRAVHQTIGDAEVFWAARGGPNAVSHRLSEEAPPPFGLPSNQRTLTAAGWARCPPGRGRWRAGPGPGPGPRPRPSELQGLEAAWDRHPPGADP